MCNVFQDENTLMRNQGREELKLEAKKHSSTRYREGHSGEASAVGLATEARASIHPSFSVPQLVPRTGTSETRVANSALSERSRDTSTQTVVHCSSPSPGDLYVQHLRSPVYHPY